LYLQFFIAIELLKTNIRTLLKINPMYRLKKYSCTYKPVKGIAEVLGYMQIASRENKHLIDYERKTGVGSGKRRD
jgi:hypothetical protein